MNYVCFFVHTHSHLGRRRNLTTICRVLSEYGCIYNNKIIEEKENNLFEFIKSELHIFILILVRFLLLLLLFFTKYEDNL